MEKGMKPCSLQHPLESGTASAFPCRAGVTCSFIHNADYSHSECIPVPLELPSSAPEPSRFGGSRRIQSLPWDWDPGVQPSSGCWVPEWVLQELQPPWNSPAWGGDPRAAGTGTLMVPPLIQGTGWAGGEGEPRGSLPIPALLLHSHLFHTRGAAAGFKDPFCHHIPDGIGLEGTSKPIPFHPLHGQGREPASHARRHL